MGVRLKGGLPVDVDNGLSHVSDILDTDTTADVWGIVRLHCDSSERHNDTGTFTHKLKIGSVEAVVDGTYADRLTDLMSDMRLKRTGEAMLDYGDGQNGSSSGDPAEAAKQSGAARFSDGEGDAPITPSPQPGVVADGEGPTDDDTVAPTAEGMTEPTPLAGRKTRGRPRKAT